MNGQEPWPICAVRMLRTVMGRMIATGPVMKRRSMFAVPEERYARYV